MSSDNNDNSGVLYMLHIASKGVTFTSGDKTVSDGSEDFILNNAGPTLVKAEGIDLALSLYKVEYRRKMFEPGHIKAEVLVHSTVASSGSISIGLLKRLFLKRPVKLSVTDSSTIIAENYYIHSIAPEFSVSETGDKKEYDIYTRLDIFSLDNLLKLDKFSEAYLGKKLVSGIVNDALAKYKLTYTYSGGTSDPVSPARDATCVLSHLSYADGSDTVEMIHPYLVQYNECLYDFAARVANRCGEAMYFEGGKLCFGLPSDGGSTSIKTGKIIYNPVSAGTLTVEPYARDSAKSDAETTTDFKPKDFNSESLDREEDGYPSDAFFKSDHPENNPYPYHSELAAEDHYILLYKDMFAAPMAINGGSIWWDNPEAKGMELVAHVLNSTSLLEMLIDYSLQTIKSAGAYAARKAKAQTKGNKIVSDQKYTSNDYAVLFAKVDSTPAHWITRKYYADVKSKQEEVMRDMVCIDLKEVFKDVKLGGTITLPNDSTEYVVVQIDMASKEKSAIEGNDGNQAGKDPGYQRIYAIPKSGTEFYPPLIPGDLFRKSGPQPAFVTDGKDPKGQGRVRVRFAWQSRKDGTDEGKYSDDSSPWIRMVTPMATAGGGGMYFQPEVGDEVMLNFESGNIDHPYVAGMLYSKNTVTPHYCNRIITSRNGHSLKFLDPDDDSLFMAGLYPGIKFLKSFGIPIEYSWGEKFHKAVGGMELTDKMGFYRISMSSHYRNITISSPFGDVCMNALTGITIKAPNGNVRIEGKNVDIVANNNLTLTSGKNIKESLLLQKETRAQAVGRIMGKKAAELLYASFIDFSLLRSLLEIMIRPVDGTLLIKSHRYLLMEAGDGKAAVSADKYNQGRFQSVGTSQLFNDQKAESDKIEGNSVATTVADMERYFSKLRQELHKYQQSFVRCFNSVVEAYPTLKDKTTMYYTINQVEKYGIKYKGGNGYDSPFDLLKDMFTKMANCANPAKSNPFKAILANIEAKDDAPDTFNIYSVRSRVETVSKVIWELADCAAKYDTCLDSLIHAYPDFGNQASTDMTDLNLVTPASSVFYTWVQKVQDYLPNGAGAPDEATFGHKLIFTIFRQWEKTLVRRAAVKAMEEFQNTAANLSFTIPAPVYQQLPDPANFGSFINGTPANSANPVSDQDWPLYVKAVSLKEKSVQKDAPGFGEGFMDGFSEPGNQFKNWSEWIVWRDTSKGEIVFSNNSNVSYRFNSNGTTERYVSTFSGELDALTDRLREILLKL